MAQPSEFPEMNAKWTGEGDVADLPVYRQGVENISRWELSVDEYQEVLKTGVVWLRVWGVPPAVCVSGESPFAAEPAGGHE